MHRVSLLRAFRVGQIDCSTYTVSSIPHWPAFFDSSFFGRQYINILLLYKIFKASALLSKLRALLCAWHTIFFCYRHASTNKYHQKFNCPPICMASIVECYSMLLFFYLFLSRQLCILKFHSSLLSVKVVLAFFKVENNSVLFQFFSCYLYSVNSAVMDGIRFFLLGFCDVQ